MPFLFVLTLNQNLSFFLYSSNALFLCPKCHTCVFQIHTLDTKERILTPSVHAISIVLFLIKIYSFSLELFKAIRRVWEIWSTYHDKRRGKPANSSTWQCPLKPMSFLIETRKQDKNEDGGHSGAVIWEMGHLLLPHDTQKLSMLEKAEIWAPPTAGTKNSLTIFSSLLFSSQSESESLFT